MKNKTTEIKSFQCVDKCLKSPIYFSICNLVIVLNCLKFTLTYNMNYGQPPHLTSMNKLKSKKRVVVMTAWSQIRQIRSFPKRPKLFNSLTKEAFRKFNIVWLYVSTCRSIEKRQIKWIEKIWLIKTWTQLKLHWSCT